MRTVVQLPRVLEVGVVGWISRRVVFVLVLLVLGAGELLMVCLPSIRCAVEESIRVWGLCARSLSVCVFVCFLHCLFVSLLFFLFFSFFSYFFLSFLVSFSLSFALFFFFFFYKQFYSKTNNDVYKVSKA